MSGDGVNRSSEGYLLTCCKVLARQDFVLNQVIHGW
jgi:hypothetical protein